MFGMVKKLPPGKVASIIVSSGDCLEPGALVLGRAASAKDGKFFIETFPRWGSDITLCAAIEPEPGKPATVYARATGPFHAEGEGEVMFRDIEITLASGPARSFSNIITSAFPGQPAPHSHSH